MSKPRIVVFDLGGVLIDWDPRYEELHALGTALYALTNWSAETIAFGLRRFEFFSRFRGIAVSGEIKLKKPDPAIFRHLLLTHALEARDCIFIDDSEKNVLGARAVGFHALHFTTPATLRQDLIEHGFTLAR